MKKIAAALGAAFLCLLPAFAQVQPSIQGTTPNIQLQIPNFGLPNWNLPLNTDIGMIDTAIGNLQGSFKGPWVETAVYNHGDLVTVNNTLYQSKINSNFNNNPTTATSAWSNIISSVSAPTPAGCVPFSNSTVTGLQCDPNISVNPTTHTFAAPSVNVQTLTINGFPIAGAGQGYPNTGGLLGGAMQTPNISAQLPRVDVNYPAFGAASGCANTADPTGVLDSTCAINAALNFSVVNPQGAHSQASVHLPAGTYRITSHLNVPCFVHFNGDGPSASVIEQFTDTENVVTIQNQSGAVQINPFTCNGGIENMTLFYPNGHTSIGTALEVLNVVGDHFYNLRLGGDNGRGINVIGSSERNTYIDITIDSTAFPITDHGNEEKYYSTQIASPGFTNDNFCYGRNCGTNHQGLPSANFTAAQVLNSASGNGVVATYVVTGETSGSTPNGTSPLSIGHFFTVSGITDVTGLNGLYQVSNVFNKCSAVTGSACTTTSTTQYVIQALNSTAGTATTAGTFLPTIVPDNNYAVWFGAQMQYFIGGSIKLLQAAGSFLLDGAQGFVEGTYNEGFPTNGRPTLDAAVAFYGVPWQTTTTAAFTSANIQAVPVTSLEFIPEYANDPADIGIGNLASSVPYKAFPPDFTPGSSTQSCCEPAGITQGMSEVIELVGANDGAVHIVKRNQSGSTAPAGTLWAAGTILDRTNDASNGDFSFYNNHLDAINSPSANWAAGCVDATPNECAQAKVGAIPDGFAVLTALQAASSGANQPTATMTFKNNSWPDINHTEATGDSSIKCNSRCGVTIDEGSAAFDPMPETAEALNGQMLNQPPRPTFMAVINTDGSIPEAAVTRPEGGQVFVNVGFNTQNKPFTNYFGTQIFGNFEPAVIGSGPHGQNFPAGYQYTDSYCYYDIPPVGGTHSLHRFCFNGGPDNSGANMGYEDDYWNTATSQWVTADSCVGTSSGQGATCTIGPASKLQSPVFETTGNTFTSNGGCSETALVGGATAGQFNAGATACSIQITFGVVENGSPYSFTHGADCSAHDIRTPADQMTFAGFVGTTGVKFTGTVAVGDTITWSCRPY